MITDQWKPGANADIEHIAIASTIDLLLVAPATANTIGKFANGIADDFLSSLYLATTRAGADGAGDEHQHVRAPGGGAESRDADRRAACTFVEPGEGYLACGWIGKGRLAEPADVVDGAPSRCCGRKPAPLAGPRVLVTAGPTFEDIDPVRFVGNRSSGRMGYALAAEALRRGAARDARDRPDAPDRAARRRRSCRCAAPPRCIRR